MTRDVSTGSVKSVDGTDIAYQRQGAGPAVILVEPAGHYRGMSVFDGLISPLTERFTTYTYDRRGRGASTDTPPYAIDREVEDVAALISGAGGSACLYGVSSGALLALQAAAAGLPIPRLALFEPPIGTDDDQAESEAFMATLGELLAADRRTEAARFFLTSIGMPAEMLAGMEQVIAAIATVAPTLMYDSLLSKDTDLTVVSRVQVPTLVLDSEGSTAGLPGWAAAVGNALPNGTNRSLPGQWHQVPDKVLAPVLIDFFAG